MSQIEKIKGTIHLSSTYIDEPMRASLIINGNLLITKKVTGTSDDPTVLDFQWFFEKGKKHSIELAFDGKTQKGTQVDDQGNIVKDTLIKVEKIVLDDINMTNQIFTLTYEPNDKNIPKLSETDTIGVNGSWTINFASPFYLWLLENLY